MAADALKSVSITALDAVGTSGPITENTSPVGAQFYSKEIRDNVTPTATGIATIGSTYKMVRLPSNIYLQEVKLNADGALDTNATPLLTVNVGFNYSDSTVDGTPVANQGAVISATAVASALVFGRSTSLAVVATDGQLWTEAKRQQPLWQALGLSKDPGGNFDLVITVNAAAATGASNPVGALVRAAFP